MTRYIGILSLVLILALAAGCSSRRTRQFIPAEEKSKEVSAGDWLVEPPSVVAFKDVIDMSAIKDPSTFWMSIKARRPHKEQSGSGTDLVIDSVKVSYGNPVSEHWRKPTRVAPYSADGDDYLRKVFDFFGDQGVDIPVSVYYIFVEFEAVVVAADGTELGRHSFSFKLRRDERTEKVPLLQE